jgi:thioredoxin-dependent peroxiredoxin
MARARATSIPALEKDSNMAMPSIGSPAPWPEGIVNQDGKPIRLRDLAGKNVLLYFYPKDDTPGCTIEACNFRDHQATFKNTVIFGASLDDAASHKAFIQKFSLPFDLLVDKDKALAQAFGALPEGAKTTSRSSALIGPDGKIKAVWPKVDPKVHHHEVEKAVG